jgi:hypothetical protein
MKNRFALEYCSAGVALVALSALAFGAVLQNPQGQYHLPYSPLTPLNTSSSESLATYAPLKLIDGKTIQLRSEDGITYIFTLTADTVFCNGETKVTDWSYLKRVPKKATITVLSPDVLNPTALVIWDKEPSISTENGQIDFTLPPMCK